MALTQNQQTEAFAFVNQFADKSDDYQIWGADISPDTTLSMGTLRALVFAGRTHYMTSVASDVKPIGESL